MNREGLGGNRPNPKLPVRNVCALIPSICPTVRLPMEITHEKTMIIQRLNSAVEA